RLRTGATRQTGRWQPSHLLFTTNSRRSHRFVKPDRGFDFRLKDRHGPLQGGSRHKWRIRAPHIKPKPTRGATNAISIAAAKIARTTSDRHRAMRRVRLHGFPTERPSSTNHPKGGATSASDLVEIIPSSVQ